jgi:hypothetical protein
MILRRSHSEREVQGANEAMISWRHSDRGCELCHVLLYELVVEEGIWTGESVPQRLKPRCKHSTYGTAEAVPLSKIADFNKIMYRRDRNTMTILKQDGCAFAAAYLQTI